MASAETTIIKQQDEIKRLSGRIKKASMDYKRQIAEGTETVAAAGAAAGFGYFEGRYPDKSTVLGLPAAALVGGGLVAASLFELVPDEPAIRGLGVGALCAAAHAFGLKKGQAAPTT